MITKYLTDLTSVVPNYAFHFKVLLSLKNLPCLTAKNVLIFKKLPSVHFSYTLSKISVAELKLSGAVSFEAPPEPELLFMAAPAPAGSFRKTKRKVLLLYSNM